MLVYHHLITSQVIKRKSSVGCMQLESLTDKKGNCLRQMKRNALFFLPPQEQLIHSHTSSSSLSSSCALFYYSSCRSPGSYKENVLRVVWLNNHQEVEEEGEEAENSARRFNGFAFGFALGIWEAAAYRHSHPDPYIEREREQQQSGFFVTGHWDR